MTQGKSLGSEKGINLRGGPAAGTKPSCRPSARPASPGARTLGAHYLPGHARGGAAPSNAAGSRREGQKGVRSLRDRSSTADVSLRRTEEGGKGGRVPSRALAPGPGSLGSSLSFDKDNFRI